ncbi:sensor histidine kinase [Planomonospora parontospora]|uniref:sensor histidine kinase n=1 Tax=Planomonospora parontospora TaxID=58119 RepID=UPI001670DD7D|nr:sensor histidine kinase [Planomonospora parontospora]GGL46706.1 anti-sigma regulatory factor [Planomonospora parontospora subsp. antibiotica]GII19420.1 anti-sigma regulatory factor [Planomonospora parontospora subsp. antibiotica]
MTTDRLTGLIHHALIYDSDQAFLDTTTGFCLDGLENDDAVLAVTTPANIALLRDSLGTAARHVEFTDAAAWYATPGRTLAAYHRYVDRHSASHRRTRIIGEPVWHGRDPAQTLEWTRYESVINRAFADSPAWIICPYDTRTLPAAIVEDARRTHPHLATGPRTHPSALYTDPELFEDTRNHRLTDHGHGASMHFDSDLSKVRTFVTTQAATLGISDDDTELLVFAVNEVATNAVQHGGGTGEIRLHRHEGKIICDIGDPGHLTGGFAGYLPPTGPHHGQGLWVVRQLCDLVEIHTRRPGTVVRLHLTLTSAAQD